MELLLVIAALGLSALLGGWRLACRGQAEAVRLRTLNHAIEGRVARRTQALRRALDDVTERAHRLGETERRRRDAVAQLRHDMRAPVHVVGGFSSLLLDPVAGEALSYRQRQGLEQIRAASETLCRLVDGQGFEGQPHFPVPAVSMPVVLWPDAVILYIEDNAANALLMRRLLEAMGLDRLHVAETGEAGLCLAHDLQPDLILLDLGLPDLDGHGVRARLAADAMTRRIPVVAVTADTEPRGAGKRRAEDFDAWLTKPLSVSRLAEVLNALLPPPVQAVPQKKRA